ncbi:MAG: hypothetical protein Q8K40_05280 [Ignavibacteria bacterium]|nr:hypothetical protein [Ignavibacteria bacterium]
MKTVYITTLLIIFYCFSGCKDLSINVIDSNHFYPLAIGNYWNYQSINYDSLGNAEYDSSLYEEKVIGDTILAGEKWFNLKLTTPSLNGTIAYKNSAVGLIMQTDGVMFKYPLVYKYPATINDVFSDSVKVIALNEMTSTLAGSFNCLVYQQVHPYLSGWLYINTYVSPGVGKVKMEGLLTTDKTKFVKWGELTLMDYKVKFETK